MSKDVSIVSLKRAYRRQGTAGAAGAVRAVGFLAVDRLRKCSQSSVGACDGAGRELAVRRALGAGHARLFRQMLTESLVLALAGGAGGLLLALWSMDLLKALLPAEVPRAADIRIDMGVMIFALAITAATGVLFGLLPAWRAARMNMNEAIKGGSRTYTAGRRRTGRSRPWWFPRCASLWSCWRRRPVGQQLPPAARCRSGLPRRSRADAALSFASTGDDKDVRGYGRSTPTCWRACGPSPACKPPALPTLLHGRLLQRWLLQGRGTQAPDDADADYTVISAGYLRALRIPIVSGRDFTDADTTSSGGVAVVSSEMARRYWPGEALWATAFSSTACMKKRTLVDRRGRRGGCAPEQPHGAHHAAGLRLLHTG